MFIFCKTNVVAIADDGKTGDGINDAIDNVLNGLDYNDLENLFDQHNLLEGKSFIYTLKEIIYCKDGLSVEALKEKIITGLKNEISDLAPTFACILSIILFLALINSLKAQTLNQNLITICLFIGNAVIIGIVLTKFIEYLNDSKQTIYSMSRYIELSFPLLITLMSAFGAQASAGVFKPLSSLLCNGVTVISNTVLIPIILLLLLFNAINSFTDNVKLNKMCDLLKSVFKWIIGVLGVIFCFFITAKGITASIYDTVSIKALKYTVGNILPLVNSMVNGGVDVVIASCVLIKNGLGVLTMIGIVFLAIIPIIKTLCFSFVLKLLCGVTESIADAKTVKFISGASDSVSYLCSVQVVVTIVYLVTIMLATCTLGVGF